MNYLQYMKAFSFPSNSAWKARRLLLALSIAWLVLASSPASSSQAAPPAKPSAHVDPTPVAPETMGRFRSSGSNSNPNSTEVDRQTYEQLIGLGYLQGYAPAPNQTGVTVHIKGKAQPGVNLIVSGHAPEASIIDMEGRVLHTWRHPPASHIWPKIKSRGSGYWRRAIPLKNGDLLAIYERIGLIKLDRNSKLLWSYRSRRVAHHDLEVMDDGRISLLTSQSAVIPGFGPKPVLDEFVTILNASGKRVAEYSILSMIKASPHAGILEHPLVMAGGYYGHILHANTLEVLSGRFQERSPAFKRGNVLLSLLIPDTVVIADLEQRKIVAVLGQGMWTKPHQPTFLENGNVLIFDNKYKEGCSRVVEFDPLDSEIAWSFVGCEDAAFYSASCGSNQRLANGNTLITETDNGRAFEVTRDKKIVWEYVSPHRAGDNNELVASLLEALRLDPNDLPFLQSLPAEAAGSD